MSVEGAVLESVGGRLKAAGSAPRGLVLEAGGCGSAAVAGAVAEFALRNELVVMGLSARVGAAGSSLVEADCAWADWDTMLACGL